jgi:hypothetical protein
MREERRREVDQGEPLACQARAIARFKGEPPLAYVRALDSGAEFRERAFSCKCVARLVDASWIVELSVDAEFAT